MQTISSPTTIPTTASAAVVVRSAIMAGGSLKNHSEAIVVRTAISAGAISYNHSEGVVVRSAKSASERRCPRSWRRRRRAHGHRASSSRPAQRRVLVALCRPFTPANHFPRPSTNREIADELVLSVPAVNLRALFQKFAVEELPNNQKRARPRRARPRVGSHPAQRRGQVANDQP